MVAIQPLDFSGIASKKIYTFCFYLLIHLMFYNLLIFVFLQLTTKKRKRVPVNPNTQFANIDNIIIARQALATQKAQDATKQVN